MLLSVPLCVAIAAECVDIAAECVDIAAECVTIAAECVATAVHVSFTSRREAAARLPRPSTSDK